MEMLQPITSTEKEIMIIDMAKEYINDPLLQKQIDDVVHNNANQAKNDIKIQLYKVIRDYVFVSNELYGSDKSICVQILYSHMLSNHPFFVMESI